MEHTYLKPAVERIPCVWCFQTGTAFLGLILSLLDVGSVIFSVSVPEMIIWIFSSCEQNDPNPYFKIPRKFPSSLLEVLQVIISVTKPGRCMEMQHSNDCLCKQY